MGEARRIIEILGNIGALVLLFFLTFSRLSVKTLETVLVDDTTIDFSIVSHDFTLGTINIYVIIILIINLIILTHELISKVNVNNYVTRFIFYLLLVLQHSRYFFTTFREIIIQPLLSYFDPTSNIIDVVIAEIYNPAVNRYILLNFLVVFLLIGLSLLSLLNNYYKKEPNPDLSKKQYLVLIQIPKNINLIVIFLILSSYNKFFILLDIVTPRVLPIIFYGGREFAIFMIITLFLIIINRKFIFESITINVHLRQFTGLLSRNFPVIDDRRFFKSITSSDYFFIFFAIIIRSIHSILLFIFILIISIFAELFGLLISIGSLIIFIQSIYLFTLLNIIADIFEKFNIPNLLGIDSYRNHIQKIAKYLKVIILIYFLITIIFTFSKIYLQITEDENKNIISNEFNVQSYTNFTLFGNLIAQDSINFGNSDPNQDIFLILDRILVYNYSTSDLRISSIACLNISSIEVNDNLIVDDYFTVPYGMKNLIKINIEQNLQNYMNSDSLISLGYFNTITNTCRLSTLPSNIIEDIVQNF